MTAQDAAPCAHNVILFQESLFLPDQKSNSIDAVHALQFTTRQEKRTNTNQEATGLRLSIALGLSGGLGVVASDGII